MRQVICPKGPNLFGQVILEKEQYQHLILSLRKKVGECLNLRLPSGVLVEAKITKIENNKIICTITSEIKEVKTKEVYFILLQWELKGDKMSLVIRQAAEIGLTHIIPIIGERSIPRKKNEKEKERREKIINSGIEQSGSSIKTELFSSLSLSKALILLETILKGKNARKLIAYEKEKEKSIFSLITGDEDAIVFAIGAEGGISPKEYELLTYNGFESIHFNTNILKAETAALYAGANIREIYFEKRWQL